MKISVTFCAYTINRWAALEAEVKSCVLKFMNTPHRQIGDREATDVVVSSGPIDSPLFVSQ
jgi:hypothetical protein